MTDKPAKYYIEGRITASYSGFRRDDLGDQKHAISEIRDLLNTHVHSFKRIDKYDPRYKVVGNKYLHFQALNGVIITQGNNQYRTNISDAYINDIVLSETGKDGIYSFGKLEGTITGTIEKPIDETVFPVVREFEKSSERDQFTAINNTSGTLENIDSATGRRIKKANRKFAGINPNTAPWITGAFIFLVLFLILGKAALPLLIVVGIVALISLISKYGSRFISSLAVILLLIGLLIWIFSSTASLRNNPLPKSADDRLETTKIEKDKQSDSASTFSVVHHRVWRDYDAHVYEADIRIDQQDYFNGKKFHNDFSEQGFNNEDQFWRTLYSQVSSHDEQLLPGLYRVFDSIGRSNSLNQLRFANMVVCFVQDIPYTLVPDANCEKYRLENPGDAQVIDQFGCFGPCKFGLQSPVEFMYNLKGDCDTRTVLLYTLFSHYGYDVAILNSRQYRHSMLGINLPVSGSSRSMNGKQYFFWETTSVNFKAGILPAQTGNTAYWNFVITSK